MYEIKEPVRLKASKCPGCKETLDAATGIGRMHPKEGDIAICARCGMINRYDASIKLRAVSEKEIEELKRIMSTQDWTIIQEISKKFEHERRKRNN